MKTYRQKRMPRKLTRLMAVVTVVIAASVGALLAFCAVSNTFSGVWWKDLLIVIGIAAAFPLFMGIGWLGQCACRYAITPDGVRLCFGKLRYRTVPYGAFPTIILTHAGHYPGRGGVIPICHTDEDGKPIPCPYLSLLTANYPIERIKPGTFQKGLYPRSGADCRAIGIAYEEALTDLLAHSDGAVYILSDIAATHRPLLDRLHAAYPTRLSVITDSGIVPYAVVAK